MKGPKGSRAKVISELRETQRQTQLAAQRDGFGSPPLSPTFARKSGLLSMDIITTCVDYFFANLYPTQPILHRQKVGEMIGQMDADPEAYCLVVSLCAYMLIQPNLDLQPSALDGLDMPTRSNAQLGQAFLAEALRFRKAFNYVENPTSWSVMTSFFFFACHFCLDMQGTAWFHLREATTLALTVGMHEEATYRTADIVESSRMRRLYWLLFVTERAYAIQQRRPLSLHASINLPTLEEDPSETVELNGFLHLVNLYRPFDDTFVGFWNKHRAGCTTEFLTRIQQDLSDALPVYLQSTESQAVDLRCSQQWLRMMVWQLSISHGLLSSTAAENAMSFQFPIEVSRDLISTTSGYTQESMEIHGIGLVEKLFDISCTLVDVISYVPIEQDNFKFGPRQYLQQMMTLISGLRGGQQRYMPLLLSKMNDTMPNAPNYSLPSLPSSTTSDIYDGSPHDNSDPDSSNSTPFGSPPMSAVSQHPQFFSSFQQELGMSETSTPSSFPLPVMSTSIDYGELTASTPLGLFHETNFQTSPIHAKFDSG